MRRFRRRNRRPIRKDHRQALHENLEPRLLLAVIPVTDTGNIVTNGTNLQNAINSAAYGDLILLDANASYLSGLGGFLLPYKAGTGTITISSTDIYDASGNLKADTNLPAGERVVGASVSKFMPKLLTPGSNAAVIKTEINAGNPSHDYSIIGVEMAPLSPTDSFQTPFVQLGLGDNTQNTLAKVAYDFVIDRCYIHGLDPVSSTVFANLKSGIALNASYVTISNSEISNIHTQVPDCQAISGRNGIGHYTVTNNYLEGSSECVLMGGAASYIPNLVPSDMTFTNNHLAKRASWNQFDPAFYDPDNGNFGIVWNIKNLFELKCAEYVLVDGNLMENSWVSGDQVAPAVLFTPRNQTSDGSNPQNTVGHVTFSNNVVRSVGEGIQIAARTLSDGWMSSATHDLTIRNNVFERIDCRTDGPGYGIIATSGTPGPMEDLVIDHNTFYNSQCYMYVGAPDEQAFITRNFQFTNNLCQYGDAGFSSTNGSGTTALNIYCTGITITNSGSGYTSAPTVTLVGGGYTTQGTATATYDAATGKFTGIKITNRGAGYTSVPTIVLSGGGGTGGAASFDPEAIVNGELGTWTFTNNLQMGPNPSTVYPAGNLSTTCVDQTFITDPYGELQGLLPTSPGHGAATPGSYFADIGADPSTLAKDFVPLDSTLGGYWKFDEGTGTTVSDSSGNSKTGTLSSSGLWTSSGNSYKALALTGGTSGSVSVPSLATSATFSFAAWVHPAAVNTLQYIVSTGTDNQQFNLYMDATGHLVAKTSNGATVTDPNALTVNFTRPDSTTYPAWYFVGCTYDDATKTLTLYKNGVAVGTSAGTGSIGAGSMTLYIGGKGGSVSSFNGTIDEVRYYNSDMSAPTFTGITSMKRLYENFGPLVGAVSPSGYSPITTTNSTFSAYSVATHSAPTYRGAPAVIDFTWSIYDGPSGVTFGSDNGTTGGQSCVATFTQAGIYTLQLNLTDPVGGTSTDIGHFITVRQQPTSVSVSPASVSVATGGTQQFTNNNSGVDQFGNALTGTWSWAVASGGAGGTITSTGLYRAPASAGADIIQLKYNNNVVTTTSTDADVTVTGATIPSVTIAATDNSASEKWDTTGGKYTVTRTGSTTAALVVNLAISGTATNGTDYSTIASTVTIPAGAASTTISLTAIDDSVIEGSETATISIATGTGYAIGGANSATVNVTDPDDKPAISIVATDAAASEGGSDTGLFTLTRTGTYQYTPGPLAVIINLSGTADNSFDFQTLAPTAVFEAGQYTTTVSIIPIDDSLVEGNETAILTVATCGNSTYTVGSPSTATVTINDNDTTAVSVSATDANASEAGPDVGVYTFTRTGSTAAALVVNYSVSGTATSGSDFSALSGTLTIPSGSAATTLTLTPINDTLIEGSETAIVTVTSGTGYGIGAPSTATVTIADNDLPTITITATDASAAEQGPDVGVFTITRAGTYQGTSPALTVNYAISGTATNGSDYSTLSGSVAIASGQTSATVTVTPIDDATTESTETAILTISTSANYTVGSPSVATVNITDNDGFSAYEDFNYTVGGGTNWNGQSGGTGFSGAWSLSGTTTSGIYSGSLSDPSGTLATSGNSAWEWNSVNAIRAVNYTFGTDGTSLWVGWLMRQVRDGASPLLRGSLWIGSDANNHIELGSPWHDFYDGQAYSSGSRWYMPSSGVAPVDGQTVFLVYRIDFNSSTPDQVRLWIDPTPGTQPSDASANSTWTLGNGKHFNFVDSNIKLQASNYYNRVTYDEIRLGIAYNSVAPAQGGGGMAPMGMLAQSVSQEDPLAFASFGGGKLLPEFKAPAAAALAAAIVKQQASAGQHGLAKIWGSSSIVGSGEAMFDSLLESPLAQIDLLK